MIMLSACSFFADSTYVIVCDIKFKIMANIKINKNIIIVPSLS